MALRGQILEIKNEGRYQFYLRIGIHDDALTQAFDPGEKEESEGLPLSGDLDIYECRLDFSDAEKPVSYPVGELEKCMDTFEKYETPEGLSPEMEQAWKIGFIVDTVISEACATDLLEVIHGDDYQQDPEEAAEASESGGGEPMPAPRAEGRSPRAINKCPDCGALAHRIYTPAKADKNIFVCEVCGRHFTQP